MNYRKKFSETLYQMMVEIFYEEHGIATLTEEEYESIVSDVTKGEYFKTLAEFRRQEGLSIGLRPSAFVGRAL